MGRVLAGAEVGVGGEVFPTAPLTVADSLGHFDARDDNQVPCPAVAIRQAAAAYPQSGPGRIGSSPQEARADNAAQPVRGGRPVNQIETMQRRLSTRGHSPAGRFGVCCTRREDRG